MFPWWHVWPPWWTMSNLFALVHSVCSGWRSTKCKTIHLESVPGQQREKIMHGIYHMKCQYFQRDRSWNAVGIQMNYWQSMGQVLYRRSGSRHISYTNSIKKKIFPQLYNSLMFFPIPFLSFRTKKNEWYLPHLAFSVSASFQHPQTPQLVVLPGEATVAVRISSVLPLSSVSPPSVSEQLGWVNVRLEMVGHDFC